jgi:hypothetical protein
MPEIQTVVKDVRLGTRKDGSPITSKAGVQLRKMKVDIYDEAVAIWDPSLAQLADTFIGKQVVCDIGSKPEGNYQNYTLYAIRLDGDGTVTLEPNKVLPVSEAAQPTRGTHNDQFRTPDQIIRQEAILAAAQFCAGSGVSPEEFHTIVDDLVHFSTHGEWK